ncbi:sulfite exporter TauE/SafE family protein [Nitratireductor pacificus]|uniref:Probable membrane transporter protein n=1 Tax=Nitratireductor pacificus pht-3B TaxID=391937 RepID=K2M9N3_9HYPH|nr:sulfite exporter TauE/SafE family protein [Nitratireductor pacificus]EKF17710.1 hypothetical protein NA2_16662 [Nitratireductor pacificus pht-3B]
MDPDLAQHLLGAASGLLVGTSLGLFGGGGSILAVPLLVSLLGTGQVHLAIGTSAVAVATNALSGLISHTLRGTVRWRCAIAFSVSGVAGALAGAAIGKMIDGDRLLLMFAGLMAVAGAFMLRRSHPRAGTGGDCTGRTLPGVLACGAGCGGLAGFFGIGGGFLVVPGLVWSTGMPLINAIGTSLVVIFAFGATTAASYAVSGLVDWALAISFMLGGAAGSWLGCQAAHHIAQRRDLLQHLFGGILLIVAAYLAWKSLSALSTG